VIFLEKSRVSEEGGSPHSPPTTHTAAPATLEIGNPRPTFPPLDSTREKPKIILPHLFVQNFQHPTSSLASTTTLPSHRIVELSNCRHHCCIHSSLVFPPPFDLFPPPSNHGRALYRRIVSPAARLRRSQIKRPVPASIVGPRDHSSAKGIRRVQPSCHLQTIRAYPDC
jgi:hypothetical protein